MRTYDIAYVPNGVNNFYPPKDLDEMSLQEITKTYIRNCAKANGKVSECSRCPTPCKEGKKAVELLMGSPEVNKPIPLYDGKTLIEKAKEENMKRRAEEAEKRSPSDYRLQGWWEESLASGDQVQWVMDRFHVTKKQARIRINNYKYRNKHKLKPEMKSEPVSSDIEKKDRPEILTIESRLESLLKEKEDRKKEMDRLLSSYNEVKKRFDELERKIDTLCSAMDIINE